MNNLEIYEQVRVVPQEAQKLIGAGRLKGFTDINPMWRIKKATEVFGACGIGWAYTIDKQWTEQGANDVVCAFCNVSVVVKRDSEWSLPIPGTGGSTYVAKERDGLYTSDEAYKMALTDALSVALKSLGFGADVYFSKDRSKYDTPEEPATKPPAKATSSAPQNGAVPSVKNCSECGIEIADNVCSFSLSRYGAPLCRDCQDKRKR